MPIFLETPSLEVTELNWIWLFIWKLLKTQRKPYDCFTWGEAAYSKYLLFNLMTSFLDLSVGNPSWESKSTSWNLKYYLHALSFVGHLESCKNVKKSLVFSGNDLLSHFLFYLSFSLLIKIFLVFWFKAKTLLLAGGCAGSSSSFVLISDAWPLRCLGFEGCCLHS